VPASPSARAGTSSRHVFGGGDGIIYAVTTDGDLLFYKDLARDGTSSWAFNGIGQAIDVGWAAFSQVSGGGEGVIYGLTPDGFLLFYKDLARNGTTDFSFSGAGQVIIGGWFLTGAGPGLAEGYSYPLSAAAGETITFRVNSQSAYEVTYLRLKLPAAADVGVPMAGPFEVGATPQPTPAEAWNVGCSWETSFSLEVPAEWPSGMYAARMRDATGADSYIVFIVKPALVQPGRIAVLASTNTWNAYNGWGGRSKYSSPPGAVLSFERPSPNTTPVDDNFYNHVTRAECWILGWLEDAQFPIDLYSENDFHNGIQGLAGYSALILSTHPEYWTDEMMDRLDTYLAGGGSVLYLGGNGLWERVELDVVENVLIGLHGDENEPRYLSYYHNIRPDRPPRAVLGVSTRGSNYMTFGPYRAVNAGHRFFNNTGVGKDDELGHTGLNGAASGWEVDSSVAGTSPDGVIVNANSPADDRGVPPKTWSCWPGEPMPDPSARTAPT
jgi:Tachylectin